MTDKAKKTKPAQQSNVKSEADTQPKPAQKAKAAKGAIALVHVGTASEKQKKTPAPKAEKSPKPAKQKMIRDSFTLPENDYTKLNMLKSKCLENGIEVKKSELVRAGLIALSKMPMGTLIKAVGAVERQKTGRPKS